MNYDSMSVEDLLWEYSKWGEDTTESDYEAADKKGEAIVSALRKAFIREESVGEIFIEQHEGYMSPDQLFTVGTKSKLKAGEFYIVPKEKT
jgi:hypothetical protein